jgi:hypothetical protein
MARNATPARRLGYVIGALVNLALLFAINVWPGWDSVPVLTDETPRVLGLLNLSLILSALANLVYIVYDPRWFVALTGVVTAAVGLLVLIRIWMVFPFTFSAFSTGADWGQVARIVLVVALLGAVAGLVVQAVKFFGRLLGLRPD